MTRPRGGGPRAQSIYGQIRLTVTFLPSGKVAYRMMCKAPEASWTEQAVVAAGEEIFPSYPPTFADALFYFSCVAEGLRIDDGAI